MRFALFYSNSPGTVGAYFHRALERLGHQVEHLEICEQHQRGDPYDVYLRIDHGDYAVDLPRHLRPRAFYAVDTHLARSWKCIRRLACHYDLVFCAQRSAAEALPRAFWVPLGCDPEVHGRGSTPRQYDLVFVGNDGGVPRKFYLQELRERYPNSFIGRAPHTKMAQLYSQSKIGFHYIECTSPLKDHISMRVYEVLASGTLLLANALEEGAFEALGLRDREQLVLYRNPRELFDLVEYYLSHEEERERIAQTGQACAIQHHTYRQRAQQMVNLFKGDTKLTCESW